MSILVSSGTEVYEYLKTLSPWIHLDDNVSIEFDTISEKQKVEAVFS